jgi:type I restriction enzyme, S subunit
MSKWSTTKLGEVLTLVERDEKVDASKEYRLLGIRLEGQGPFLRETVMGTQTSATKLFRVAKGDFIYSRLFACRGAFGVITQELDGCYVSGEFPTFVPVPEKVDVEFLKYWFRLPSVIATVDADCSGSTPLTRNRFKENFFLALEIPLPPLVEQRRVVARIEELAAQIHEARTLRHQAAEEAEALTTARISALFEGDG